MADKKLSSVSAVSDASFVYAETSSGETVKISKADLASVVAGLIGNPLPVKGWTNNIDANTQPAGIVYCGENSVNCPESYCILFTLGENQVAQIAIATQTNIAYVRSKKGNWKAL